MSKKKIIRNLIIVLAVLILVIILIVNMGDINKIWNYIINANGFYISLAIIVVLLYALTYQASLMILIKYKYKTIDMVDLLTISGSEFFFNAITPFSSGGQPFQAYALKRRGMRLADSTSVLLINFICYQVCLNLLSVIFLIVYFNRVHSQIDSFIGFLILGFSINMVIMLGLLSIGLIKPVGKLFIKLFDLICKIKFLKKLSNKRDGFVEYIENMQMAFKEISKSIKTWVFCVVTKIISFIFYYSIPFIALLAIGFDFKDLDFPYTLALTAFTLTIAIWFPTPGGSGGVEYAFKQLFTPYLTSVNPALTENEATQMALGIMLIWRMLTYYVLMLYGFILYLLFEKHKTKYVTNNISNDELVTESPKDDMELNDNNDKIE